MVDKAKRNASMRKWWAKGGPAVERAKAASLAWRLANKDRHAYLLRRSHLKKAYGITPEDYDAMLARQGGLCAICRNAAKLVVDHNHVTGKVRGLLCPECNQAIGLLKENRESLRNAVVYLDGELLEV